MDRNDALAEEYDTTIRVVAVLVERLQQLTGSVEVQISDEAMRDQPDLTAWRHGDCVSLAAAR